MASSWPRHTFYNAFNKCPRRLKLKKFVLIFVFLGLTASFLFLIVMQSSNGKLENLYRAESIPKESFKLASMLPNNDGPTVGDWNAASDQEAKLGIDNIRTFGESKVPVEVKRASQPLDDDYNDLIEVDGHFRATMSAADHTAVKLKLVDFVITDAAHRIRSFSLTNARHVIIPDLGLSLDAGTIDNMQKHMLILGHYEQLGKTTVNFFEAAKLAYLTNRRIVKPYIRNSRFCGLTSGWTGSLRERTRAFFPLDLYFNISLMEQLLQTHKLGDMEYLETFRKSCSYDNAGRRIVIIYFLYEPRKFSQKVLSLSDREHRLIERLLNQSSSGWVDCSFINKRIKIDERIGGNVKAGRQYCVDPNRVVDVDLLENKILKNDPCVVIHQWKGTGYQRTHFNLTSDILHEDLLKLIVPSDFVISEVRRFTKILGSRFIGVHIRAERQLLWYSIKKYTKCMDLVYREVQKVRVAKKIKSIFISADIGPYGSDTIEPNLSQSAMKVVREKFDWLVGKLNATTFSVLKEKHHVWTDSGLAAFTQLHILSQASNLVTLGSGTFQKWITDKFKNRKLAANDKSWTITRTCFAEHKKWKTNDASQSKTVH